MSTACIFTARRHSNYSRNRGATSATVAFGCSSRQSSPLTYCAISRRGPIPQTPQLQVADLVLDPAAHSVTRGNHPIVLTRKEYRLLELLMRHHDRVLSRTSIIESVWGAEDVESNTLDAFIKKLRQKVDAGYDRRLIHTVRGFGYRCGEERDP